MSNLHPLRIQDGENCAFEANDLAEMQSLVALWKKELLPHLYDDIDPALPKSASTVLHVTTEEIDALFGQTTNAPVEINKEPCPVDPTSEKSLSAAYRARFGRRFMYRPDSAHRGKTKLEALRAKLGV